VGSPVSAVAAIDCGTNSTRLLVEDGDGRPLTRLMRITRLGEGVDRDLRLTPPAIARVTDVLTEFRASLDRFDVPAGAVRMTATSAARDAVNRDEFFAAAEAIVGVRPELLDGDEEGRLSFLGATGELSEDHGCLLVADIGGGSTELVVGVAGKPPYGALSLDAGCVRLTERWIRHDPAQPEELANAIGDMRDLLEDADRRLPELREAERLVGLAGTVATVAALDQGLAEYDRDRIHHYGLTREAVEDWFRTMAMADHEDRLGNPGLEEARADVIVGGMCALVAIIRHYDFDECLVSEADILDGLCAGLRYGRS
jgi:exopolyphosphatase / guanosine-5'-triphosphate,3'-diphosphate pyrophosphatase